MAKLSIFIFSLMAFWPAIANSQSAGRQIRSGYFPPTRVALSQAGNPQAQTDFHDAASKQTGPFESSPAQVKTVATRLKGFGIPFQLNASDAFIEVQLYLSRDMGQTWQFQGRQDTDRQEFPFEADADGEYWFSIKTLNRDRKLIPEGDPQAELKIIVDTIKPKLDFSIEADAAGRVACRWLAQDKNIAPETMQIYYQPMVNGVAVKDWIRVPVDLKGSARNGTYSDQLAWWPETSERTLNVAAQISDISGNSEQLFRQVVVAPSAWRHRQNSTARITDPPKAANPIRNPWVQPESIPGPTVPAPTTENKMAHSNHPPNVVCEGGICRIVSAPKATKVREPVNSPKEKAVQRANGRSAKANSNPNVVNHQGETFSDFSNPPNPNLSRLPQNLVSQNQLQGSDPNAIEWESESEKWGPKYHSSFGSTVGPDPSLAPRPGDLVRRLPATQVPSNPSTIEIQDNEFVGQSSTKGQTNQYRGLNTQPNSSPAQVTFAPGARQLLKQPLGFGQMQVIAKRDGLPERNKDQPWTYPSENAKQSTNNRPSANQVGFPVTSRRGPPAMPGTATGPGSSVIDPSASRLTKAPSQIIGSMRFRLNYGIDSIDPSGVAKVDLWMTRDEGRTWNAWGSDPNNESPFPVEVKEEGRYGFRVVVHSKDGLTGQGPSSGDDADMWILVDTTSPLTRITSVPYGRGKEAGRLVINYAVSDAFLTVRPITLMFATNPEGPWVPLAEGVRNDGRYVWKPTPQVPDRIFLRIESIDKAGNVGAHTLSQAIDVSGLIPRGTIHGVVPVGR